MDDFGDNLLEVHRREWSPYYRLKPDGQLEYVAAVPKDFDNPWEKFKKESLFYRLFANKLLESKFYAKLKKAVNEVIAGIRNRGEAVPASYSGMKQQRATTKGWPLTLRLLEKFRDEVEADDSNFIVVDGPDIFSRRRWHRILQQGHGSSLQVGGDQVYSGLPDTRPPFSKDKREYFFRDDHPRASGYDLIAGILPIKY